MEGSVLAAYKVVLAGDTAVGKTSLISQYISNKLPDSATLAPDFANKIVPITSSGSVKLQLWDTAGQERYRTITPMYYRGAAGVLVVFDLTQENTFQSVLQWVGSARSAAGPDVTVMLVGNKRDLVEENSSLRAVTFETAQTLASSNGMLYMEVSAVSRAGVNEAFEALLNAIHQKRSVSS
jgi:small GTP-binding protein